VKTVGSITTDGFFFDIKPITIKVLFLMQLINIYIIDVYYKSVYYYEVDYDRLGTEKTKQLGNVGYNFVCPTSGSTGLVIAAAKKYQIFSFSDKMVTRGKVVQPVRNVSMIL